MGRIERIGDATSLWRKVPEAVTSGVEPFDGQGYLVQHHLSCRKEVAFYYDGWISTHPIMERIPCPEYYMPLPPPPEPDQ